jgi:long-chain acyl-CoA synthetase
LEVGLAADGEILARGSNVTVGYWNDAGATRQAIREGWFHTGDLGTFDDDGFLTVTGRKKDLLILSNGKKVTPTEVEELLVADSSIDQALVYGEGRSFLTALVVPSGAIRACLATAAEDPAAPAVLRQLSQQISRALARLPAEMQVRRFLVLSDDFSLADGSLTVTMKPRREAIYARYQTYLDRLYTDPREPGDDPFGILAQPRAGSTPES